MDTNGLNSVSIHSDSPSISRETSASKPSVSRRRLELRLGGPALARGPLEAELWGWPFPHWCRYHITHIQIDINIYIYIHIILHIMNILQALLQVDQMSCGNRTRERTEREVRMTRPCLVGVQPVRLKWIFSHIFPWSFDENCEGVSFGAGGCRQQAETTLHWNPSLKWVWDGDGARIEGRCNGSSLGRNDDWGLTFLKKSQHFHGESSSSLGNLIMFFVIWCSRPFQTDPNFEMGVARLLSYLS